MEISYQVVQIAEHTDLAKLGNPRQQSELVCNRPLSSTLHRRVSVCSDIRLCKLFIADGLQHGLVIFVYQNGNPLPRLLVSTFYHAFETEGEGCLGRQRNRRQLPSWSENHSAYRSNPPLSSYFRDIQIDMQDGTYCPSLSPVRAIASPSNNSLLPWK